MQNKKIHAHMLLSRSFTSFFFILNRFEFWK